MNGPRNFGELVSVVVWGTSEHVLSSLRIVCRNNHQTSYFATARSCSFQCMKLTTGGTTELKKNLSAAHEVDSEFYKFFFGSTII